MGAPPLKVLLLAETGGDTRPDDEDGGAGASYLEMLLRLHGRFQVSRDPEDGHDATILCADALPRMHPIAQHDDVPLIVVPHWPADAWEVEALVEAGADDVVPWSELNPGRLESVVRKALARRQRLAAPVLPRKLPLADPFAEPLATAAPPVQWGISWQTPFGSTAPILDA